MRVKIIVVVVLAMPVAFLMWGVETARACSCVTVGKFEPCRAYGSASAVFVGVANGVEKRKIEDVRAERKRQDAGWDVPSMIYSFAVEEAFGGVEGSEVKIGTNSGGGDCGYQFTKGERYLIYAYGREGNLSTSICTPTKPIAKADDELKFLRNLASREPGVTLSGAVMMSHPSKENAEPPIDKRVAGLPIIVEGGGERRELQTDAEGRYQLTGLKAETYTVKVTLPDELHTHRAEEKVVITERGCGGANFFISDNGRISGKAMDAEGQPVPRITINALPIKETEKDHPDIRFAQTDEEGKFKFEALPVGRYLLGVRLSKYPQQNDPTSAFPRVYHPGVETAEQAEPVIISAGEHVKDFALVMPPRRAERVIKGLVVWADGKPVAKANISYRDVTYHDPVTNNGIQADEQGRFTIKGYEGQIYVIEARSNPSFVGDFRRDGPMERVEPLRITLANPTQPVRIVVTKVR
ncbi:MAG: carboxypeptidase regulatory-like domain-containing protein [Acidobacteriota bacterium]|nr:carboxypeptidase regulatory-like domain-containing protein [Acidobacteriota bacterium]